MGALFFTCQDTGDSGSQSPFSALSWPVSQSSLYQEGSLGVLITSPAEHLRALLLLKVSMSFSPTQESLLPLLW